MTTTTTLAADLRRLVADDAAAGEPLAVAALAAYTAHDARPSERALDHLHAARLAWAHGRAEQARREGVAVAVCLAAAWALGLTAWIIALAR
jgi:hypothetical protein